MPIFKQGRSTHFTAGNVGYIKADIKSEDGQTVHRTWIANGWFQKPFAEPGDSGALCWDQYGEWCGLLFAGTLDGAGYVIPAQAVVDDVKGHHWVHFGVAIAGDGTRLVIEEKRTASSIELAQLVERVLGFKTATSPEIRDATRRT